VTALLQVLKQLTIVQKPAGYFLQTAVYDQSNVHINMDLLDVLTVCMQG
jgi:hypothetical protein